MDTVKLLASWANSKVGKGKEYNTNDALAKAVGISEATVRRIKQGKPITLENLDKLAGGHFMTTDKFLEMVRVLSEDPSVNITLNYEIISEFNALSDKDQKEIRGIMKLKRENPAVQGLRRIK